MDGIEHELENMRGYLMKSTTHCLRNYWRNGIMGKKDFRQLSCWKEKQNLIRWKSLKRWHNTPVKWRSNEKNMILPKQDDEWKEQHHNASGRNERMEWNERRETRSWESTLTTYSRTELLETNNERISLMWVYWRLLKIMRWNSATKGNNGFGLIWTSRRETISPGG